MFIDGAERNLQVGRAEDGDHAELLVATTTSHYYRLSLPEVEEPQSLICS